MRESWGLVNISSPAGSASSRLLIKDIFSFIAGDDKKAGYSPLSFLFDSPWGRLEREKRCDT